MPGGSSTLLRIIVSDGINTASDETDSTFTVDKKQPYVKINTPKNESTLIPGNAYFFTGGAFDIEDGVLIEESLVWSSNIDGEFGVGEEIYVSLSNGFHVISLSAEDSDGNISTIAINILVGYETYLPIIIR